VQRTFFKPQFRKLQVEKGTFRKSHSSNPGVSRLYGRVAELRKASILSIIDIGVRSLHPGPLKKLLFCCHEQQRHRPTKSTHDRDDGVGVFARGGLDGVGDAVQDVLVRCAREPGDQSSACKASLAERASCFGSGVAACCAGVSAAFHDLVLRVRVNAGCELRCRGFGSVGSTMAVCQRRYSSEETFPRSFLLFSPSSRSNPLQLSTTNLARC
jgi:hypothetical protein